MTITAYQVHDKGEEGERWGEKRVGVKELYRQVQACVSEKSLPGYAKHIRKAIVRYKRAYLKKKITVTESSLKLPTVLLPLCV